MRVLLKPKWVLGHILIVAMSVLMVNLGIWQLHRLDDRKDSNREAKAALNAIPLSADGIGQLPEGLGEYTRVSVTGTWDPAHTVYRRYPIRNGIQGYEVLMPLKVNGGAMVVNRGFIPIEQGRAAPRPEFATAVQTTVTGYVRHYDTGGSVGQNEGTPPVPTVTHTEAAQLRPLMGDVELCKYWVQLKTPADPGDPLPLEEPVFDEGSHFSYMLQWFAFTATIIIGWVILCSRVVRGKDPS